MVGKETVSNSNSLHRKSSSGVRVVADEEDFQGFTYSVELCRFKRLEIGHQLVEARSWNAAEGRIVGSNKSNVLQ